MSVLEVIQYTSPVTFDDVVEAPATVYIELNGC